MFLESYPFLLGCQIRWRVIVHSILIWFFVFLQYLFRFFRFHFWFCLFGFSLSSSSWIWLEAYQFCLPFQRTSFWFYWFFSIFFLNLYFISSRLYYFLPSADVRFFLFLILLGGRLVYWFEIFFLFFEEGLYRYELPSKNCFCSIP